MTTHDVIDGEAVEVSTELVPAAPSSTLFRTNDPAEVLTRATATSKALADVIERQKLYAVISGKKHLTVEAWLMLSSMLGVTPVCVWTRQLSEPAKGWEARVEARTLDGRVVGAAEAMCVRTENRWSDADDYAIRSMAQTRATSKALGSVLRFVVTLAGYSGTPAEELDGVARQESGTGPKPSDKQLAFLERLLKERPDVDGTDIPAVKEWTANNLAGGRDGTFSRTIDALKAKDTKRAENTAAALVQKAKQALAKETDVPPDMDGLTPEQIKHDEGIPWTT